MQQSLSFILDRKLRLARSKYCFLVARETRFLIWGRKIRRRTYLRSSLQETNESKWFHDGISTGNVSVEIINKSDVDGDFPRTSSINNDRSVCFYYIRISIIRMSWYTKVLILIPFLALNYFTRYRFLYQTITYKRKFKICIEHLFTYS